MTYQQRRDELFELGWRARERGECREANPHARAGLDERQDFRFWDHGWVAADDEIAMDKKYGADRD